jgi:hypothetical protein
VHGRWTKAVEPISHIPQEYGKEMVLAMAAIGFRSISMPSIYGSVESISTIDEKHVTFYFVHV